MHIKTTLPLILVFCLILVSCRDSVAPLYEGSDVQIIKESSYQALLKTFKRHDYKLDQLDKGIPPLVVRQMPADLDAMPNVGSRKRLFFKIMLPLVLLANNEILLERQQLLDLETQFVENGSLSAADQLVISDMAARYRLDLDAVALADAFTILRRRIDVIPVDLALAQAANESAWGTSRFTRVANNLFGQWTFIRGQGIVPDSRPEGESYEIRQFDTIFDSVRGYANNLNSHHAYSDFRRLRAEHKQEKAALDGISLAEGLLSYSIRGEDYVREIQAMIRHNNLGRLARATLRSTPDDELAARR